MRALSAPEMLGVWERGLAQSPVERALTLLAAACPETSPDALASMTVGQRDASLLMLREWAFGSELAGMAMCPGCCERLELNFGIQDIRVGSEAEPEGGMSLTASGYELRFRLANSMDLMALEEQADTDWNRLLLFRRCVLSARRDGEDESADQLPADVIDAVAECMAEHDPQADVQLAGTCPLCGHQWRGVFEIVSFFWSEIDAWAQRLLREVHMLASAYGWHEREILALSPWRRQLYLEMVGR
jgi:hypothetical protein